MQQPKRALSLAETERMRELVGNAYDDVKRDAQRARRDLEEALRILDSAGHSINRS